MDMANLLAAVQDLTQTVNGQAKDIAFLKAALHISEKEDNESTLSGLSARSVRGGTVRNTDDLPPVLHPRRLSKKSSSKGSSSDDGTCLADDDDCGEISDLSKCLEDPAVDNPNCLSIQSLVQTFSGTGAGGPYIVPPDCPQEAVLSSP